MNSNPIVSIVDVRKEYILGKTVVPALPNRLSTAERENRVAVARELDRPSRRRRRGTSGWAFA
jgi:hypothetical protein